MAQNPHQEDKTADEMAQIAGLAARFAARRKRLQTWLSAHPVWRQVYRAALIVVATFVIIAGILMLVLPGPGWLTIFLGLAILGTEFAWARRALTWVRKQVNLWIYRWQKYRANRKTSRQDRV